MYKFGDIIYRKKYNKYGYFNNDVEACLVIYCFESSNGKVLYNVCPFINKSNIDLDNIYTINEKDIYSFNYKMSDKQKNNIIESFKAFLPNRKYEFLINELLKEKSLYI